MSTLPRVGSMCGWLAATIVVASVACHNPPTAAKVIDSTGLKCDTSCSAGLAVVYGHVTATSGLVVPAATVIVKLYSDTLHFYGYQVQCGGRLLADTSAQLDEVNGNYRIVMKADSAAGKRVCVDVTGDPHGLYSDVGIKRVLGGWVELRQSGAVLDSLLVEVRYSELAVPSKR